MIDQTIITTRSQIVKAYTEWVKQWENTPEDNRLYFGEENYPDACADYLIKLLHSA